jgi:hypothetical protein
MRQLVAAQLSRWLVVPGAEVGVCGKSPPLGECDNLEASLPYFTELSFNHISFKIQLLRNSLA